MCGQDETKCLIRKERETLTVIDELVLSSELVLQSNLDSWDCYEQLNFPITEVFIFLPTAQLDRVQIKYSQLPMEV